MNIENINSLIRQHQHNLNSLNESNIVRGSGTENRERSKEINYQRIIGKLYKDIGAEFGITQVRARDIHMREEARLDMILSGNPWLKHRANDSVMIDALGLLSITSKIKELL